MNLETRRDVLAVVECVCRCTGSCDGRVCSECVQMCSKNVFGGCAPKKC